LASFCSCNCLIRLSLLACGLYWHDWPFQDRRQASWKSVNREEAPEQAKHLRLAFPCNSSSLYLLLFEFSLSLNMSSLSPTSAAK
jgi:hypothetical protein